MVDAIGIKVYMMVPHRGPWSFFSQNLTHWCRVTHTCVSKLTIIGSDNGLSLGRRQAIIWTNAVILLIRTLGTNFSEIVIEIQTFSLKKMHLKVSSGKWRPFCLGLNVLSNMLPPGVGLSSVRVSHNTEIFKVWLNRNPPAPPPHQTKTLNIGLNTWNIPAPQKYLITHVWSRKYSPPVASNIYHWWHLWDFQKVNWCFQGHVFVILKSV